MNTIAELNDSLIGHYLVEKEIGQGGMATVYLARDIRHDRKVAIKVLHPELAAVIGAERFLAEIRTTANLQHPHILPLHDSGNADGMLYYVMPFVEGVSLRDRISREHQLPIGDAVRIATEIASALSYAHRHGVIHRDIKPENILLHDGSALVADFGIAIAASKAGTRMTETGMSLGTPQYMSPEQAMGERDLDARSDIYALGCVTYEMLAGEPPFSGPTAQAIVAKVMTSAPAQLATLRHTVPPAVADAVHTALHKVPADRFSTAADFSRALTADGVTRPARVRRRAQPAAMGAALFAAGALIMFVLHSPGPATSLPQRTRLTFTGDAQQPLVAPDGKSFAYVRSRCIVGSCPGSLVLQALPSGEPSVLVAGMSHLFNYGWNAVGSAIVIGATPSGGTPGVYVVTRAGVVRRIYDGAVAWAAFRDASHVGLSVVPRRPILIADASTGDIVDSIRVGAGDWALQSCISWTRTGFLVFSGQLGRALLGGVADAHGTVLDTLRLAESINTLWAPAFAANAFVFTSDNRSRQSAMLLTIDGHGRIAHTGTPIYAKIENSVAEWIAPTSGGYLASEQGLATDVWSFDLRGRAERLTHSTAYYSGWTISPDGHAIVAIRQDALGTNAYLLSSDGTERALTADSGIRSNPQWLPDHRHLAITVAGRDTIAYYRTEIIDIAAGTSRQYPLPPFFTTGAWLPHGRVVGLRTDGAAPVVLDSIGRQLHVLPDSNADGAAASPLPDTSAMFVVVGTPARSVVLGLLDGSGFKSLGRVPEPDSVAVSFLVASRDGKTLFFSRRVGGGAMEIWRMAPTGAGWSRVATLKVPCDNGSIYLSDDAQRGVCTVTDGRPDIWLVERGH